jgi:16S rRNA (guanine966-N2)-methyltransferase
MRVIAGTYRSRTLRTLHGLALRPTSDRLRETLFNVIGAEIADSIFVDLFAGSGAVGIEALSRGAHHVIFAEKHRAAAAQLRANLESLGIPVVGARDHAGESFGGTAEMFVRDACAVVEQLTGRGAKVDFVFADPPYADAAAYQETMELLGESPLMPPASRLILEHERKRDLPPVVGQLERVRVLAQGSAALSFYRVTHAA